MKISRVTSFIVAFLACVPSAFAASTPDFPVAGWATQNGGITGGTGYDEVTVDNTSDLATYAKAGNKIIYVKPGSYDGPIDVGSNVTIYGYQGAIIKQPSTGSAIKISGSDIKNIIIRNLTLLGAGALDQNDGDCLQINNGAHHIWIDHTDISDGHDGNLDVTNGSNYVTISWTKFSYSSKSTNHQYSNLIGINDETNDDMSRLVSITPTFKYSVSTGSHELHIEGAQGKTFHLLDSQERILRSQPIATNIFSTRISHSGSYILRIGNETRLITVP